MSSKVKLYTTPSCPFCVAALRLLDEREVPYENVDVSDYSARAEAQDEHDWPTVPIVLGNGELIGGFSELEALDAGEGLEHLK